VRSNVAVLRIVFHPAMRGRTSGFLSLPLELRHPGGLAILACIITATPGTSWARYDAARNVLTIHVLDLVDEHAWIAQFKDRYERRLMEIFQ
jgi:multicomponent K+:H+ antiporter subunit E